MRQPPNCRRSGCGYDKAFIWTDIPCAGYPTEAPTDTPTETPMDAPTDGDEGED